MRGGSSFARGEESSQRPWGVFREYLTSVVGLDQGDTGKIGGTVERESGGGRTSIRYRV